MSIRFIMTRRLTAPLRPGQADATDRLECHLHGTVIITTNPLPLKCYMLYRQPASILTYNPSSSTIQTQYLPPCLLHPLKPHPPSSRDRHHLHPIDGNPFVSAVFNSIPRSPSISLSCQWMPPSLSPVVMLAQSSNLGSPPPPLPSSFISTFDTA